MNPYLKNVKKLEFVITYACTGKCKHCSEGNHPSKGVHIDSETASRIVSELSRRFRLQTVMTFGGEPLLYPQSVFAIHKAAKDAGVKKRQVITNGYFTKDEEKMLAVAAALKESGVNEILLSVDAFHQETIPLNPVMHFAAAVKAVGIPVFLQPAWLVSREDANSYNLKTRAILEEFRSLEIPEKEGNVIFPEGNALVYLKEYFVNTSAVNPYEEDPLDVRCLSVDPNGILFGESVYETDLDEILSGYQPI